MIEKIKKLDNDPALDEWCILAGYRGSKAHGMFIPSTDPNSIDDIDLLFIAVPPPDYYIGIKQYGSRGTRDFFIGEYDIVVYEVRKFIDLLKKGNPNVLSMLWLDEYFKKTTAGYLLIQSRNLFASQRTYWSFSGYAKAQIHRMTHGSTNGYMGEKRKKLVEKYGYDCKNAAHAVRLLRMGAEFLLTGELKVRRSEDAEQLLSIKRGEYPLEEVKALAEELYTQALEALEESPLPAEVDEEAVNALTIHVIRTAWAERK